MLSVCDCISDDVLKENFEDTTGLFVDEAGDTFHSTSPGQTTDGWFGDTLDVITQNFPVTLGAPLSKSFSSFTSSRHVSVAEMNQTEMIEKFVLRFYNLYVPSNQ
jgi:hypothetical protein